MWTFDIGNNQFHVENMIIHANKIINCLFSAISY